MRAPEALRGELRASVAILSYPLDEPPAVITLAPSRDPPPRPHLVRRIHAGGRPGHPHPGRQPLEGTVPVADACVAIAASASAPLGTSVLVLTSLSR